VPLMVGLAAATALLVHGLGASWAQAFVRGLTVLVIACPCALGIAVPLARIAGMSRAGRKGILVRDFEAFERSRKIDCVVFDKTGTLTHGRWSLERLEARNGLPAREAEALAAGLEKNADHAIARAVAAYIQAEGIEPARVERLRVEDHGVYGLYQGREARIGTWDFAVGRDRPPGCPGDAPAPLSAVYLSLDRQVGAVLWFGDKIRPGSAALVQQLRTAGYQVHLISGDSPATTAAVARSVGIDQARGGLLPKDKADYVAGLQQEGRLVVMVGDGINDAPALARADLSVALQRDAALAQQAANLTLMRGDPAQFTDFLELAGQVNAKVAQNLACAWVYNLVGIPIAMSGWLNPLVAAAAMLLSSLTVIGNTLLLVRRK
jgi:P-type Cu+ transporter